MLASLVLQSRVGYCECDREFGLVGGPSSSTEACNVLNCDENKTMCGQTWWKQPRLFPWPSTRVVSVDEDGVVTPSSDARRRGRERRDDSHERVVKTASVSHRLLRDHGGISC